MKSIKELAQEVLDVQNASNIIGVTLSFHESMMELRNHTNGNHEIDMHPITFLWVSKLESMVGTLTNRNLFEHMYDKVVEMAKG